MPDNGEAVELNDTNAPVAPVAPAAPVANVTLSERVAELLLAIKAASDDEINDAYDALALIPTAINDRIAAAVGDVVESEAIAA